MVKAADLTTSWAEVNCDGGGIQYRLSVTDTAGQVQLEQRLYRVKDDERAGFERAALADVANREARGRQYTIPVEATITGEELGDLLSTALDAGLPWCREILVTKEAQEGVAEFMSDVPILGGSLTFVTDEGERSRPLDGARLLRGLVLAVKAGHVKPFSDDWLANVDAPVAWAVLELALFGEVRYC